MTPTEPTERPDDAELADNATDERDERIATDDDDEQLAGNRDHEQQPETEQGA